MTITGIGTYKVLPRAKIPSLNSFALEQVPGNAQTACCNSRRVSNADGREAGLLLELGPLSPKAYPSLTNHNGHFAACCQDCPEAPSQEPSCDQTPVNGRIGCQEVGHDLLSSCLIPISISHSQNVDSRILAEYVLHTTEAVFTWLGGQLSRWGLPRFLRRPAGLRAIVRETGP